MLQQLADGLILGSITALGAIGVTLTYSILRFANFAHGEFLTFGAYLALVAIGFFQTFSTSTFGPLSFGWPLLAATAVAVVGTALLALLLDWLLFSRLRQGAAITLVIASFGAALALRNLLFFGFGGDPAYFSRDIQIAVVLAPHAVLGGVRVTPDQIAVLALAAACVFAMHLFLTRTTLGRAMRAVAHNPQLATVVGIDVAAVIRWTWMIGAGLAAVAGVFAGLTVQVRPTMGFDLLLPLFSAAILGGIGSVYGAVLGGLVVGLAESLAVPLVGAEYRAAVAFVLLILILLVRPTGLFGERGG